jgi:cytochrome c oxidase subunit I+III
VTSLAPDARPGAIADLERAWSSKRGIPGFVGAVNHKQVGLRFIWTGVAFLLVGGIEGLLIRLQLIRAENTLLGPEMYNQIFTMHGTTMMFLFAIPILEGFAMYFAPLQIGTRDLPFPRLNAFGYWMYLAGGLLLNWSFVTGSVPDSGWFAYTPLTGPEFSPTRALDFWLLGVTFVEIAGIIGAVEIIVLILRFRAPGMSLGRMPLFTWASLLAAGMMLFAFPFVIAASLLLELERKFGAPFYAVDGGGNPLLWQHLFWIFGHPEVYIMLLPATGMVSAVVAAHVARRIVAYPLVVAALIGIAIVSFGLWVHHMFATGLPVMVVSLFAVASYSIAIPSGIQVFAWIATIWDGRPRWRTPMWFVAGFMFIFVLGGITGVMVATAPWDLQSHDTFFVVAHFHYVIIGGVVFPILAALHHWFPKMTGRLPGERMGKLSAAVMFIGFNVTFFPQHWLGMQGMLRRVYTYDSAMGWGAWNMISTLGAFVLALGFLIFFANLAWAWGGGEPARGDPWNGDSLEWAVSSPPPAHNFDVIPTVGSGSPMWDRGDTGLAPEVERAVAVTGASWRNRREVIQTSVLDARPETIVSLPGPSYWPFVTATLLTAAIIGVLVDWWVLAGAGAVAALMALVAWNLSNRRLHEHELAQIEPDDPEFLARTAAEATFAEHTDPGASAMSWAVAVGLVGVATIAGAFVYSYVYLRLGADTWPLDGTGPRPLWVPLAAAAAVVVGALVAPTLRRGRAVAAIALLVTAGGLVTQLVALAGSGVAIDADAYEALVVTLEVFAAVILATGVLVRAAAVLLARPGREATAIVSADGTLWVGASLLWLALWATVHLGPRIL